MQKLAAATAAAVVVSGLESVVATATAAAVVAVTAIAAAEEDKDKENEPAVIASATHNVTSFFSFKRLFISAFIDRICGVFGMCYKKIKPQCTQF